MWLAHLFLLPYYKFLCKQPGLFYESEDTSSMRLLSETREEPGRKSFRKKSDSVGGE